MLAARGRFIQICVKFASGNENVTPNRSVADPQNHLFFATVKRECAHLEIGNWGALRHRLDAVAMNIP